MDNGESVGRFTSGELKVASFWVRYHDLLRGLLYGGLIGLSVLFWGYVAASFVDAYVISFPRESLITRQIALNQQLLAALGTEQPLDIGTSDVTVLSTTEHRYDMMVEMSNPNAQWWVEFQYHFNLSGEDTPQRSGYILPGSKQILTELGYATKTKGSARATLIVDNIRWHRVDPTVVGADYQAYAEKRQQMSVEGVTYDTGIVLGSTRVGQSSFTLVNQSSYGFWNVDLVVRLYRGSAIVAVNKITVSNIKPGEKRPVSLVWLENISSVSKTEVIPQVNLLDASVYLPSQYFEGL